MHINLVIINVKHTNCKISTRCLPRLRPSSLQKAVMRHQAKIQPNINDRALVGVLRAKTKLTAVAVERPMWCSMPQIMRTTLQRPKTRSSKSHHVRRRKQFEQPFDQNLLKQSSLARSHRWGLQQWQ